MTLAQAIAQVDDLKPNTVPLLTKIQWLAVLDGLVKRNVADTHLGGPADFVPYDGETPPDTVLLIESPYDTLYRRWLEAQIDLTNGEYDRYNASIRVFSDEYSHFENDYHRNHTPKRGGRRFLY